MGVPADRGTMLCFVPSAACVYIVYWYQMHGNDARFFHGTWLQVGAAVTPVGIQSEAGGAGRGRPGPPYQAQPWCERWPGSTRSGALVLGAVQGQHRDPKLLPI